MRTCRSPARSATWAASTPARLRSAPDATSPTYQKTTNPNHVAAGFPQDCTACHTTTRWTGATFDHTARTRFTLTGGARAGRLRAVPRGRQVRRHRDRVRRTATWPPSRGPPIRTTSRPDSRRTAPLATPRRAGRGRRSITPPGRGSRSPARTCRSPARSATWEASSPAPPPSASAATWRPTRRPPTRTTSPPDSRRTAPLATRPPAGRERRSITRTDAVHAHRRARAGRLRAVPRGRQVRRHVRRSASAATSATYQKTTNPNHVTAGFPQDCTACHTTTRWTGATFDHTARTRFPLTGAHVQVACAQCHVGGKYAGTPPQCVGCHLATYQKTTNPNHVTAGFPQDCTTCHTTARWTGATFDHTRQDAVHAHRRARAGRLRAVPRGRQVRRHASGQCVGLPPGHLPEDHQSEPRQRPDSRRTAPRATPPRAGGRRRSITASTRFAADRRARAGRLRTVPRGRPVRRHASRSASGCHLATYQKTTNPNHVSRGLPAGLHHLPHHHALETGRRSITASTRFALTGAHVQVACAQCHVGGSTPARPPSASGCHLPPTRRPPTRTTSARASRRTAPRATPPRAGDRRRSTTASTRFALTGAHVQVACAQCHVGGKYAGTSAAVRGLPPDDLPEDHQSEPRRRGLPADCASCHTTAQLGRGQRSTTTPGPASRSPARTCRSPAPSATPEAGTRARPPSASGATSPTYPEDHQSEPRQRGLPADLHHLPHHHGAGDRRLSTTATTRFPLTGAHVQVTCAQCHVGGRYAGTPTTCVGCHLTTYQRTTNPNHVAAGFPQDCSRLPLHDAAGPEPTFNHSTTQFPLVGRHTSVACAACHAGGVYAGLATTCVSCHLANYQRTTNPNHATAGFPQQCEVCHTPSGWTPSSFNHSFDPVPAHRTAHVGCVRELPRRRQVRRNAHGLLLLPQDGVHFDHRIRITSAAGFPTTCQTCHTTTAWSGRDVQPHLVPGTAGHMAGGCAATATPTLRTTRCSSPARLPRPRPRRIRNTRGRTGYVYNSANCYQCHPQGGG